MSEPESVSERELAVDLAKELFGPRSEESEPEPEPEPEPQPEPEQPEVVTDTPEQPEPTAPSEPVEEPAEPREEEEDEVESEDDNVVWATRKYGDDPARWAKAAYDLEQITTRLGNEKREAETLAAQWYEYATQAEQQAQQLQTAGMPLSSAEEEWADQAAASNPYGYARQAVMSGNMNLYNAVISRVAEENPMAAAQIGTQIQMELQQLAAQEQMQHQPAPLAESLGASFQRLGLSLEEAGPQMMEKVAELGEHNEYVQAMLYGEERERDLAVRAVYDLAREGRVTKRRVRDEAREATIRREAELRREAAGVVTGAPHTPPPQEDPFLAAMTEEWKARRQWGEE